MLKKYKKQLLLSSLLCLLPALAGLLFWQDLGAQINDTWLISPEKLFSTQLLALILPYLGVLALHWVCVLVTLHDPKNREQGKKPLAMLFWIAPTISLFIASVIYSSLFSGGFGQRIGQGGGLMLLMGLMFLVMGNYLPKIQQNFSLGIKVHWALRDEENWNATHRFGGKLWVAGGLAMLFTPFLPGDLGIWLMILVLTTVALLPILYSYLFYRKKKKAGLDTVDAKWLPWNQRLSKGASIVAAIIVGACLLLTVVLFTTGNIDYHLEEESFTIEADYWADLTINYADIQSLEYREVSIPGSRTNGYGSPVLLMGQFKNDEFGYYTRYTYTKCDTGIVLQVRDKILVLSGRDAAGTQALYDMLRSKWYALGNRAG